MGDHVTQSNGMSYHDRASKAAYLWQKYRPWLEGRSILDVGADRCHLKQHLDPAATYWGLGLGGNCDQTYDLEKGSLPFADDSFDCVLCLDVLEHLESLHAIFDECCRVARQTFILSLPNAWSDIYGILRGCGYRPDRPLKFYGLPVEPPPDRHRWFFSLKDARQFIRGRARLNGMQVRQMEVYGPRSEPTLLGRIRGALLRPLLFGKNDLSREDIFAIALWAVLEKPGRRA